jgi:hypothetical protein
MQSDRPTEQQYILHDYFQSEKPKRAREYGSRTREREFDPLKGLRHCSHCYQTFSARDRQSSASFDAILTVSGGLA